MLDRKRGEVGCKRWWKANTVKHPVCFPAIDSENNFLLQSHRRLAADLQLPGVFSLPLVAEDETLVGTIIYAGEPDALSTESFHAIQCRRRTTTGRRTSIGERPSTQ